MTDIVDRLRALTAIDNCQASLEAAAEIERLRAALNRLADDPFSDLASVRAFVCSVLRRGGND